MFSIIGCATNTKVPIARVPTKVTSYPLVDYKGVEHKYTDNFDSFIFPNDNKKHTINFLYEVYSVLYISMKNNLTVTIRFKDIFFFGYGQIFNL